MLKFRFERHKIFPGSKDLKYTGREQHAGGKSREVAPGEMVRGFV